MFFFCLQICSFSKIFVTDLELKNFALDQGIFFAYRSAAFFALGSVRKNFLLADLQLKNLCFRSKNLLTDLELKNIFFRSVRIFFAYKSAAQNFLF